MANIAIMTSGMAVPSALIIGASRGLGLALVLEYLKRGSRVIATHRGQNATQLHEAQKQFAGLLEVEAVDIAHYEQIVALRSRLTDRSLDLLFVNAGITNDPNETIGKVATEDFVQVMVTNALGPMRVIEILGDLVRPDGTIAAMSSRLASVAANDTGGWEVYRGSKAALNSLMRSYAARHRDSKRTLLLMAPGWVRTDMGGPDATLGIDDSIPRVVDTVTAASGTPGLRYLDYRGEIIPW